MNETMRIIFTQNSARTTSMAGSVLWSSAGRQTAHCPGFGSALQSMMIKAKFKVVICGYFECYGFLMIRTSEAPGKQIGLDKYYQWAGW